MSEPDDHPQSVGAYIDGTFRIRTPHGVFTSPLRGASPVNEQADVPPSHDALSADSLLRQNADLRAENARLLSDNTALRDALEVLLASPTDAAQSRARAALAAPSPGQSLLDQIASLESQLGAALAEVTRLEARRVRKSRKEPPF